MRRSSQHSGFTLVEVLVSVAIALLLILGVNSVFKVTSQTVGAGESLLAATRDSRTILQTLLADLVSVDQVPPPGSVIGNAPFFIIRSEHVYAFRNATDQQVATSPTDPSTDTNIFSNVAVFPGNRVPCPMINTRSHRIDRLGFFSRGLFARQTSSSPAATPLQYVSTTTGAEAWIVYGHSQQPNKGLVNPAAGSGGFCDPGDPSPSTGKNDYNFLASDWMLSRMAMVLIPIPNTTTDPNYIVDNQTDLTPLSVIPSPTTAASKSLTGGTPIYSSRFDLAQTSIANYSAVPLTRTNGITSYTWGINPATITLANPTGSPYTNYGKDWWDPILGGTRYQASPFILAGTTVPKITASTLSTCAPDLIRGCSQFIVEYAGNFYTKNADGTAAASPSNTLPDPTSTQANQKKPIPAPVPDPTGQLDFYIDANGTQHTRWYGYPRLTTGNVAGTQVLGTAYTSGAVSVTSGDVVPLRDVLAYLNPAWATVQVPPLPNSVNSNFADAERFSSNFPAAGSNYWTTMPGSTAEQSAATRYTYTAAWGPDVHYMPFPKMIRIVIEVDDHEGRLNQPQRYEFIYDVAQ